MGAGTRSRTTILAVLCTVLFVTFLDNTIVSVTLADIQSSMKVGVQGLQWVVNGYKLAFVSLMLLGGMLGDFFGRRKVMVGGLALFSAGSVVAAVAPTSTWLIVGRVVMGVGAAGSEPGTLSIIRHVYEDRPTRAKAMGVWAAVSGVALAMGPIIAGVLVGLWTWRLVFWFNLVIGVSTFVATLIFVPESADPEGTSVDWKGAVLGASALSAGVYAVTAGETAGYKAWWIIALFLFALACGSAFVFVELRAEAPMLNLRLMSRRRFGVSNLVAFTTYFGIFSIFFFVALYLQLLANQSAFGTALDFLPMAVIMIAASAFAGTWVARSGAKIPMTVGCVFAGVGILVVDGVLDANVGFAQLSWSLAIAGAGFGIALVPVVSSAMDSVKEKHSGMAASATNTSRELGAVLGVAVLGTIVNGQLNSDLTARLKQLGIPANFQSVVIEAVTHGGVPGNAQQATKQNSAAAAAPELVKKVIGAAERAFYTGLHTALLISACMLLASAVIVWFSFSRAEQSARGETPSRSLLTYGRAAVTVVFVVGAAFGVETWIGPSTTASTSQSSSKSSSSHSPSKSSSTSSSSGTPKSSTTQSSNKPEIKLDPSSGLHDGQKVKVQGSGFRAGTKLVAIQCAGTSGGTSAADCDIQNVASVTADDSGDVSSTVTVHKGPFGSADRTCGGDTKCLIAVSQPSASSSAQRATASLSFGGR